MTQEVLKLALEALENFNPEFVCQATHHKRKNQHSYFSPCPNVAKYDEAITAIKEALRENAMREVQRLGQEIEQEPVVGITAIRTWFKDGRVVTQTLCNSWVDTTPPQPQPVAYWKEHAQGLQRDYDSLLADFQAQRSESSGKPSAWVGLTDEEIDDLWESTASYYNTHDFARAIEAKLKQKNGYAEEKNNA